MKNRTFRQLIFTLLLLLSATDLFAQSPAERLNKYHTYRDNFNHKFNTIGDSAGMSIPIAYRSEGERVIKWSDATIDLGWYLGMLATENYILRTGFLPGFDNGNPNALQENENEIYFALKAMYRLDSVGETAFAPCSSFTAVNGFFIRDDTDQFILSRFPGMNLVYSDYNSTDIYNKEMSQDQVYHMLMGTALVKAFVDTSTTVLGMNLVEMSKFLSTKIVSYMQSTAWSIKNATCNNKTVNRGPDAQAYSYGTNSMIKFITNGAVAYDNDSWVGISNSLYNASMSPTAPTHQNPNNTHMGMVISAVGNTWGNNTLSKLMGLAPLHDFHLYVMLNAAMHNPSHLPVWFNNFGPVLDSVAIAMMDSAPLSGPYNPSPDTAYHRWGGSNRFIRDRVAQMVGTPWTVGYTFNGLDYLLLFNLHQIISRIEPPATGLADENENKLTVFPNPNSGVFKIESGGEGVYEYHISDISGRTLISGAIINQNREGIQVDASMLKSGIYVLNFKTEKGAFRHKIVIE